MDIVTPPKNLSSQRSTHGHYPKSQSHSSSNSRSQGPRSSHRQVPPRRQGNAQGRFGDLASQVYVVFDLETTGGNPEKNGITEVCALKVREGEIIARFYSLVNPKIPVPPIVRKMTGITNQMLKDAPEIHEVMPGLIEFIGDAIVVSHNAIGDLGFLRYFSKKVTGLPFDNYFLCTHLLVERLYPQAKDKSLKGLCKLFELPGQNFHRAEADAILTLGLFNNLYKRMQESAIQTVEQAIRLQGDLESASRLGWAIKPDKLRNIPSGPGVFYLFDHERRLLFLSSAQSIQKEVLRLENYELVPKNILRLALKSSDIKVERIPSLLSAMIAECEARERYGLAINPSSLHQRVVTVVGIYAGEEGQSYRVVLGPIDAQCICAFGPVRDRRGAQAFLEHVADVIGERKTKTGFLVSKQNLELVEAYFTNTLSEFHKKSEKMLLGLRIMFWRTAAREQLLEKLRKIDLLRRITSSQITTSWKSIFDVNGVAAVPDEGTAAWAIYVISSGRPKLAYQVRGDYIQKLRIGGVGKRLLSRLETASKKKRTPVTALDAAKINAVQWWLQCGESKTDGEFIDAEALSQILNQGSHDRK
jgi:DNA polymerase III epsilon subunit family exonuclease